MKYSLYRFILHSEKPAYLGQPLPFIIRSTLGNALKKFTCVLKQQECKECILKNNCIYSQFFEVIPPSIDCPKWVTEYPKPFAIMCSDPLKMSYKIEEELSFEMALFGKANEFLPYLVIAIKDICGSGIGKKMQNNERATFILSDIFQNNKKIYDKSENLTLNPPLSLELPALTEEAKEFNNIEISLLTPLRIKSQNHLSDTLLFYDFFKAVLRRIHALECSFGNDPINIDYEKLLNLANDVATTKSDIKWTDWRRYSGRQKSEMKMGGLTGKMILSGDTPGALVPYLRYVEKTLLGKQTTFGLGKIEVKLN